MLAINKRYKCFKTIESRVLGAIGAPAVFSTHYTKWTEARYVCTMKLL